MLRMRSSGKLSDAANQETWQETRTKMLEQVIALHQATSRGPDYSVASINSFG